jgi:hypothetical protein
MVRWFLGSVLAVLLAVVPVARNLCDLACAPAAAPAAVPPASHCASHGAEPSPLSSPAPADRCGHDHHALLFVTAAPSAVVTPELACAAPVVHFAYAGSSIPRTVAPVARGGPSHAGRSPLNLRI